MEEIAYKIESREELLEKIIEELQILESIFDGEGVVLSQPIAAEANEMNLSTASSGKSNEDEDQQISQFAV
jgi:hypothetical protein